MKGQTATESKCAFVVATEVIPYFLRIHFLVISQSLLTSRLSPSVLRTFLFPELSLHPWRVWRHSPEDAPSHEWPRYVSVVQRKVYSWSVFKNFCQWFTMYELASAQNAVQIHLCRLDTSFRFTLFCNNPFGPTTRSKRCFETCASTAARGSSNR